VSQTPTYDQLREQCLNAVSKTGSPQINQPGKHRRSDNLAAAPVRDRPPEPKADLATDWSWFGPGEPDRAAPRNVVALMSTPTLLDRTRTLLTVLDELDVRPHDRVLIMLPEGPGFTESFAAAFYRDAMPLPINPLLSAPDLTAAAIQAHARLVLASPAQFPTLTKLHSQPPILIYGPHGPWAAALRLR